jgi:hypothetical protein
MQFVVEILELICLILIGAISGKPIGWIIVGLSVIALLFVALGGFPIGHYTR